MENASHITRLELTQFKAHTELVIANPGRFVVAQGGNGSGKTSVLDAITVLVEGAGAEVIRTGADRAQILAQIGPTVTARRLITGRGKGTLTVKHGVPGTDATATVNSPAKFLTDMMGASDFDPLSFFTAQDGKARKAAVLAVVDITIAPQDWATWGVEQDSIDTVSELGGQLHPLELVAAVEASYYTDRAAANKAVKAAQAEADKAKPEGEIPQTAEAAREAGKAVINAIAQTESARSGAIQIGQHIAAHRAAAEQLRRDQQRLKMQASSEPPDLLAARKEEAECQAQARAESHNADAIESIDTAPIEAQIAALQQQLADAQNDRERKDSHMAAAQDWEANAKAARDKINRIAGEIMKAGMDAKQKGTEAASREIQAENLECDNDSIEDLDTRLSELRAEAQRLGRCEDYLRRHDALWQAENEAKRLDTILTTIREQAIPTLLERAEMPVEGLGIAANDITFQGVAGSQLSGSEKVRVGLAIAQSRAGSHGIILLDEMERLDTETYQWLIESTRGDGFQYLATRVTDGPLEITDADDEQPKARPAGLPS